MKTAIFSLTLGLQGPDTDFAVLSILIAYRGKPVKPYLGNRGKFQKHITLQIFYIKQKLIKIYYDVQNIFELHCT